MRFSAATIRMDISKYTTLEEGKQFHHFHHKRTAMTFGASTFKWFQHIFCSSPKEIKWSAQSWQFDVFIQVAPSVNWRIFSPKFTRKILKWRRQSGAKWTSLLSSWALEETARLLENLQMHKFLQGQLKGSQSKKIMWTAGCLTRRRQRRRIHSVSSFISGKQPE